MYQRIVLYFLEAILKGLLLIINGHQNDDKIVKAYNKYAESTLKFMDSIKDSNKL